MSGSIGRIDLDLGLDYGSFNRELDGIANKATYLVGGAFKGLGGIIAGAFAVGGLVAFGKEAIGLASDLQEVQNVVDVTFGSMAAEVNNWSKNLIDNFGLSELSAKRYSSTMGAMLKSSGLTGAQMKDMSKQLTELAADMSSFYNLSNDDAFYKVFSGLTGETEPLKQLGVNMNIANLEAYALSQGIKTSYQNMSQANQTLLRYNYLLSVTKDAQGDFARTSQSWANQTRVLAEQWKIFQGTMGAGFINILTPVIRGINLLISKLQVAAQYFKAFTAALFGDASSISSTAAAASASTSNAANSIGDVGTAATDTGKAVKKAGKSVKGSLAGFDQLNTLSQATAKALDDAADSAALSGLGAGLGDMGAITPQVDTSVATEQVQGFANRVKGVMSGIGDTFRSASRVLADAFGPPLVTAWGLIAPQLERLKGVFGSVFSDIKELGAPLKNWFIDELVPFWQKGIVIAGKTLAGLLDSFTTVFEDIWDAVFPILSLFVSEGLPRLTEFLDGAVDIFSQLFDNAKMIFDDIWEGAAAPAMAALSDVIIGTLDVLFDWWDTWGSKITSNIKTSLDNMKELWRSFWDKFLQPFFSNMLENSKWLWEKHLKGLLEEIGTFIGKLITAAQDINNKFIAPLLSWLVDKLGPTFKVVFKVIGDVITSAVALIADVLKGLIKALGGVIDFIAGVFTGDWKRAWEGIKTFAIGIWDAVVGAVKGAINIVIDLINGMIDGINMIKIDIPEWAEKVSGYDDFGVHIPRIPRLAKGGLAYGPTLAMVGDNRGAAADPEVISPLSKLQELMGGGNSEMLIVLESILEAIRRLDRQMILMIGETELGRAAINAINKVQRQEGRTLIGG
ncbi:hypothetical protein [Cohnella sp. GbtcB17]|uniref:hypothetical protein n=1 Tax=Cohnella sp. GbtcB17 TaxID=2824762 RepID=UPI001C30009C|nr:hypothetical protein [Cohnella sp. GbtcB17]